MDDIFRMATNREDAQYGNDKMREVLGPKQLRLNLDKSCYIVVGNKKARIKLQEELHSNPLILFNSEMKEENLMKYLGDYFFENTEESVHQTVLKRINIAKHLIHEIRTIVEDVRAKNIGGITLMKCWAQPQVWENRRC